MLSHNIEDGRVEKHARREFREPFSSFCPLSSLIICVLCVFDHALNILNGRVVVKRDGLDFVFGEDIAKEFHRGAICARSRIDTT